MAITNGYATLDEAKKWLGISDAEDDLRIEIAVEAASRAIDDFCTRRFYSLAEVRTYTADAFNWLPIDDLVSLTSLKTDEDGDGTHEITWQATDYILKPANAALNGKPYTSIITRPRGTRGFPAGIPDGVRVEGMFGFPSTSSDVRKVKQAALIQMTRLFKRKDSPYGVAGASEFGQLVLLRPTLDPDVQELLMPLRRFDALAIGSAIGSAIRGVGYG